MIFAAGLGTRLQPLTHNLPKALAPFNGRPLLWHAIKSVEQAGAERVIVNVHHFAHQIIDYLQSNDWGLDVCISDETDQLLDTGGGLVKAKSLFIAQKPILIRNVDIISSADMDAFLKAHQQGGNAATLMVKQRNSSRYLSFDEQMRLCGWKNINTGEHIDVCQVHSSVDLAFSGVHIVEPPLVEAMGDVRPFSIIQAYLSLAAQHRIVGYRVSNEVPWFDVGTIEKLKEAELYYKSGK
ncbi:MULTISPECIES: nucleotidyltransferase family protein [unclassified Carboxylicivirga]|uniref:nucleotidyltransferase family protein n=1 Tax=Carboxylicivirga TaxID=1628153 RepID=UPI003D340683